MHKESFWKLNTFLFNLNNLCKRKRGKIPNGDIDNSMRLRMALRWMTGGDKMDIAPHHGCSFDEVM